MKRLLLLSAICFLLSQNGSANNAASILNLSLRNNQTFFLTLDGQNFPISNHQRIENLRPGKHFISAYTRHWRHHGYVSKLVFRGPIFIDPATETFISLFNGSMHVDQVVNLYQNYPGNCGTNSIQNNLYPINDYDFSTLLNTLRNASFESTKMGIANQVLYNNYFTSYQVKQIITVFSFENSRLEFAKAAYQKTIDPQKYFIVHDAFSFSSSSHELNHFIASR